MGEALRVSEILNNVHFEMGTACHGLQDQLAHGKLAKALSIWARQKRNGKVFLGSLSLSVYELTMVSVCKD